MSWSTGVLFCICHLMHHGSHLLLSPSIQCHLRLNNGIHRQPIAKCLTMYALTRVTMTLIFWDCFSNVTYNFLVIYSSRWWVVGGWVFVRSVSFYLRSLPPIPCRCCCFFKRKRKKNTPRHKWWSAGLKHSTCLARPSQVLEIQVNDKGRESWNRIYFPRRDQSKCVCVFVLLMGGLVWRGVYVCLCRQLARMDFFICVVIIWRKRELPLSEMHFPSACIAWTPSLLSQLKLQRMEVSLSAGIAPPPSHSTCCILWFTQSFLALMKRRNCTQPRHLFVFLFGRTLLLSFLARNWM